jgi:hypothetical protein
MFIRTNYPATACFRALKLKLCYLAIAIIKVVMIRPLELHDPHPGLNFGWKSCTMSQNILEMLIQDSNVVKSA